MLSHEHISQLTNPEGQPQFSALGQNSHEMGQDSLMDQSGIDSMNVGGTTVLGF